MSELLRILLLEDDDSDAELVDYALRGAGYLPTVTRAKGRREFEERLGADYDVILADYKLPDYDALQALALAQERGLDVPLVVVTGTLGEERAVECVRLGCCDYVLKDNLLRLGSAVAHALATGRLRAQKREAERRLQESERRFRALVENATEGVLLVDADAGILQSFGSELLGFGHGETVGWNALDLVHPADLPGVRGVFGALLATPRGTRVMEMRGRHRSGRWIWLSSHAINLLDEPAVGAVVITFRDVSELRGTLDDLTATRERLRGKTELLDAINSAMTLYLSGADWQEAHGAVLARACSLASSAHAFSVLADDGAEKG